MAPDDFVTSTFALLSEDCHRFNGKALLEKRGIELAVKAGGSAGEVSRRGMERSAARLRQPAAFILCLAVCQEKCSVCWRRSI